VFVALRGVAKLGAKMATSSQFLRIGTGAGFAADRLDPAVDLAERGALDVMVLECLGERTVAFAHRDRMADPARGYNAHLDRRMRALLPPCRAAGTTIVTNMGAANPRAAAERTLALARSLGLKGIKIACILALVEEVPGFALAVMRVLSRRLRRMDVRYDAKREDMIERDDTG